jgi:ABC-type multidrug transport system fused ATPase/permease subunit
MTQATVSERRANPLISPEVRRSLAMLSRTERRTYWSAVGLQMATSLLDLAGVLLFGMVGVIAASATQGLAIPNSIQVVLSWFGGADLSATTASLVLAGIAALLLIIKTIASLWILRWVLKFLTTASTRVSAQMCADFYALPIVHVNRFASQWSAFALVNGVTGAIAETLTNSMVIWVELSLLVVLGGALLLLNPLIALFAVGYFGLIAVVMNQILKGWAYSTGKIMAETSWESNLTVQDGIATYREITVADRRQYYIDRFRSLRQAGSEAYADQQFIGQLPRYGMEIALVVGAGLLVIALLQLGTAESALGSLALFLTAATRVMPSMLRLNGSRINLRSLRPRADYAYTMAVHIEEHRTSATAQDTLAAAPAPEVSIGPPGKPELVLEVAVRDLKVDYPGSDTPAITGITFTLPPGGSLAVVGPSGGGKSTLADAILGVLQPSAGSVRIGGLPPAQVVRRYPGLVAYVPQSVALVSGSVRDNVALGLTRDEIDDEKVWAALQRAHLADYLGNARKGLDTEVGERGVQMSGGQRQRLGIARALYTDPRLLVMDEATSALDAEIENLVTQTIEELGPEVTTITIAHRLATIRRADTVIYLDRGRLLAQGTFDEVRNALPRFDHQANLLGL